ncbi:MAG: winged helix-turn-helix transcriptional regulator [Phycisphaerales bacterium]
MPRRAARQPARAPGTAPGTKSRSQCPIACSLDLVGDKWTLLVLRDMILLGKQRYNQFAESPERIASNILTDRLQRLEKQGLILSRKYRDHPPRYEYHPTPAGADLLPVLKELVIWGAKHIEGAFKPTPAMMRKVKRDLNKRLAVG